MEKILRAAGVPQPVLDMIPDVVDTCMECRAWMKRGPAPTPTVEIAVQQNDQVEADIMFYKEHQI